MKEKIKKISNKVVNSVFFIILLAIFITLKTILFYKCTVCVNEKIYLSIIGASIIFIFPLMAILYFFPRKVRNIIGLILNLLISIILFADNIYYTYSNNVLSVLQITNLQYGEEIMLTLPMLLKIYQILYFIDLIILVVLLATSFIKIEKTEKSSIQNIIMRIIIGLISVCLLVISIHIIEICK